MASRDSCHSPEDSSGSNDPDQSSAVPNSRLQIDYAYATDPGSAFDGTLQKKIDEEDGQSDESEFHTPAQVSKHRRLPSLSSPKRREAVVAESDFDSFERDFLFDSPPSRKRGFRRPRKQWSPVKEWSLQEYDREVAYEEIKAILEQSLEDAGPKVFVKSNPKAIAGFRQKQVGFVFLIWHAG